jgi:integration host factor subunit beta
VNKQKKDILNKSDIEESLRKEFPKLTNVEIIEAVDIVLNSIIDAVALDEKVEIRGFGTFSKKLIRPRKFKNPKTKKVSYLGETATMHFKPSKSIIKK